MNNDGEIRALTGKPNPDFAPSKKHLVNGVIHFYVLCTFSDVFGLQRGSGGGRYIIYVYAMVPANRNNGRYALTVVKDQDDQWRLKYSLYSQQNSHNYEWCFSYRNDAFAIKWCSNNNTSGKDFVLQLDNDELTLTPYAPNTPLLPKHFISSFHSMY